MKSISLKKAKRLYSKYGLSKSQLYWVWNGYCYKESGEKHFIISSSCYNWKEVYNAFDFQELLKYRKKIVRYFYKKVFNLLMN
jgi:hypothetical protein